MRQDILSDNFTFGILAVSSGRYLKPVGFIGSNPTLKEQWRAQSPKQSDGTFSEPKSKLGGHIQSGITKGLQCILVGKANKNFKTPCQKNDRPERDVLGRKEQDFKPINALYQSEEQTHSLKTLMVLVTMLSTCPSPYCPQRLHSQLSNQRPSRLPTKICV
jgi:hypothetical protein